MYEVNVRDVNKSFGSVKVLSDISLSVKPGELFFLLGPSGCGKTTLLRLLAGFEQLDSGEIFFDKQKVNTLAPQRRSVSLVFQNYALWPHLNVEQNISFGLENQKLSKGDIVDKVSKILELVRMKDYAKRLPNQLSGGQQQRVALARALVVNPKLLLLDEPLSNLDARLRMEMRFELLRLQRQTGITTIYVTHDQEEALSLADRIAFLDKGNLVQVGTPLELYQRPSVLSTGLFLGNATIVKGTIESQDDQSITVQSRIGKFISTQNQATGKDLKKNVVCFFRPENVKIGNSSVNCFNGKLHEVMFEGTRYRVFLECQGVVIESLVDTTINLPKKNSSVNFYIQPESVIIFEDSTK